MKFKQKLLQGTLIKRYKRFFVDIKYQNETITAHCPNSGSMMGLLNKGNSVWFSVSNNPKRKLRYTLEIIDVDKKLVGINTFLTNKIVCEAILKNKISHFKNHSILKPEAVYKKGTRFDFYLEMKNKKIFIEVKNVTLVRKKKIAEFPDSITKRGTKHLEHLIEANKKGYTCYMLYLIQRNDCIFFKIADDIDPVYKKMYKKALDAQVKMLCFDCKINQEKIEINNPIQIL